MYEPYSIQQGIPNNVGLLHLYKILFLLLFFPVISNALQTCNLFDKHLADGQNSFILAKQNDPFYPFGSPNDQVNDSNNGKVRLFFFWSHSCPHCLQAKPFVETLIQQYPWLVLHSYDLMDNPKNINTYLQMAGQLGIEARSVPGFVFCGQMMTGFDAIATTGRELEDRLVSCHENTRSTERKRGDSHEKIKLPFLGEINSQDFSLPVFTLIIASIDAFNPCAFFVLFFLLSLIVNHRNRLRIAVIGGTFVLFSGLMYFLFMAAWLNIFLFTRQLAYITTAAGFVAIIIGLINIKDYFFNRGFSLSIPESAKPQLFQRMRKIVQAGRWPVMLTATVILAIVANSYELLCTAGLPMIYTRVLTFSELGIGQYYFYLILYNIVYIIPLLIIVAFFTFTMGSKKISEQQGRMLKLLSGIMMLGLGGILFHAPEQMNNMLVSMGVIVGAISLTLVFVVLGDFFRKFRSK